LFLLNIDEALENPLAASVDFAAAASCNNK
jgi:hypothetical protein